MKPMASTEIFGGFKLISQWRRAPRLHLPSPFAAFNITCLLFTLLIAYGLVTLLATPPVIIPCRKHTLMAPPQQKVSKGTAPTCHYQFPPLRHDFTSKGKVDESVILVMKKFEQGSLREPNLMEIGFQGPSKMSPNWTKSIKNMF